MLAPARCAGAPHSCIVRAGARSSSSQGFYWNPATGEIREELPTSADDTRGGILADEMVNPFPLLVTAWSDARVLTRLCGRKQAVALRGCRVLARPSKSWRWCTHTARKWGRRVSPWLGKSGRPANWRRMTLRRRPEARKPKPPARLGAAAALPGRPAQPSLCAPCRCSASGDARRRPAVRRARFRFSPTSTGGRIGPAKVSRSAH